MNKTKNPDALTQEPVASVWMYKDTFGDWKPFLNDQHRIDTIASGEWECTQFFATPQPAASVASGEPPKEATAAMYLQLTDALEYSSGKDGMEWSPEEWAAHLLAHYKATAQLQPRTLDAAQLRRLLCLVYSRGMAYIDDGEMSDSQRNPAIDFLRDAPAEIERKINARNADTLTPPAQKVLSEHSGCGSGTQHDSLNVKLNPGDKVVLHKGRMTQGFERAEMAIHPAGEQA